MRSASAPSSASRSIYRFSSRASRAPDRWTVVRLFLMPFCVSSFSQLIKGKGFVLVFPPSLHEIAISLAACAVFVAIVLAIKRFAVRSA